MKKLLFVTLMFLVALKIQAQEGSFKNNSIVIKLIAQTDSKSDAKHLISVLFDDKIKRFDPVFNAENYSKSGVNTPYNLSNFYKLTLKNPDDLSWVLNTLNTLPEVEYAEPYPVAQVFESTNDPLIASQYYLNLIKAYDAFDYTKGDTSIIIGIVDSGIDLLHQDLKENIKYNYNDPINNIDDDFDGYVDNYYGWDMADNDSNPQSLVNENGETNYHGTKVAGMASAVTHNGLGIASVGYRTKILPIKAMDSTGLIVAGYEGIVYAADHGCSIINCSWGGNYASKFAQDVINYATEYRNCVVVAAAGNKAAAESQNPEEWFYPASYKNVISVAATGTTDLRWSGSSYATTVDVSAPGENVLFTKQNNSYGTGSGTSYAAPLVAGLAGLVKSAFPEYNYSQVAEQIRITSDVIDTLAENSYYTKQLGYGRINALRAVTIKDLPSVRIEHFNVSDNYQSSMLSGDTLTVSFAAKNYLTQISETTIRLTTNSSFIVPISNIVSTGEINTLDSVSFYSNPFMLKVIPGMPTNSRVRFVFEIRGENYNDYQIYELNLNLNYIDIETDKLATTITGNGNIGYANREEKLGQGLIYNNENILNEGGIIIAASNTRMASALFSRQEFDEIYPVDTTETPLEIIGYSTFKTSETTGLDLTITQTTQIPKNAASEKTVLYKYKVKNMSASAVNQLKMAQYLDWDLFKSSQNVTEYLNELNLLYTYNYGNDVLYTGLCLLNPMDAVPYGFDLVTGGNGGIDITLGYSNDYKWYAMTNSRPFAGNFGDSINITSQLTTDYFNLNTGDSAEIAFAHLIAPNYAALITLAKQATADYNTAIAKGIPSLTFNIYPNPVTNFLTVDLNRFSTQSIIEIYNLQGRLEMQVANLYGNTHTINISSLKLGIYIIKCLNSEGLLTKKLIKQ